MYTPPTDDLATDSEIRSHPEGSPYKNIPDTRSISMLGLGMVIGAAIGAGVALLAAPRSGEEMRDQIRDRVRSIRGRDDVWSKLKRELGRARKIRRRHQLEQRKERAERLLERERTERDARVTVTS